MTEVERIIEGLTKAQVYLLDLAATNEFAVTLDWRRLYTGGIINCLSPFDHGRCEQAAFKITPLGLQVKAALETKK